MCGANNGECFRESTTTRNADADKQLLDQPQMPWESRQTNKWKIIMITAGSVLRHGKLAGITRILRTSSGFPNKVHETPYRESDRRLKHTLQCLFKHKTPEVTKIMPINGKVIATLFKSMFEWGGPCTAYVLGKVKVKLRGIQAWFLVKIAVVCLV